jgi:sRNA-binding protein
MYYHKPDREEFIRYLAERFPKCFFEDPSQRRPLKHNIIIDLERENILEHEKLSQTLDWYTNHFAYRYSLMAGAERVDLDGNKAGTVTPQEQQEARAWIAARKRELIERQENQQAAVIKPAVVKLATNGHVNGAVAAPSLHPSLTEMQSALTIVSGILTEKQYEPLRPVLATAALREIVNGAEKLIGSLQKQ